MLILIDIILLILVVVGIIREHCWNNGVGMIIIGVFGLIISLSFTFYCLSSVVSAKKSYPQQIQIYEEENKKIENQVSEAVQVYLAHESEVYSNINPSDDSLVSVVAAIPELNSSQLIAKQIEILENNNAKIKELRGKVAEVATTKWWLYFGG